MVADTLEVTVGERNPVAVAEHEQRRLAERVIAAKENLDFYKKEYDVAKEMYLGWMERSGMDMERRGVLLEENGLRVECAQRKGAPDTKAAISALGVDDVPAYLDGFRKPSTIVYSFKKSNRQAGGSA